MSDCFRELFTFSRQTFLKHKTYVGRTEREGGWASPLATPLTCDKSTALLTELFSEASIFCFPFGHI